jgi:hypothetical protein
VTLGFESAEEAAPEKVAAALVKAIRTGVVRYRGAAIWI